MRYTVGKILYVISKKSKSVIPVQVVEEVTRKTVTGESISYVVMLPGSNTEQVALEKLDAKIFSSVDDVRRDMVENATNAIEKIIQKSLDLASESFKEVTVEKDDSREVVIPMIDPVTVGQNEDERVHVDLGNGIRARVNLTGVS